MLFTQLGKIHKNIHSVWQERGIKRAQRTNNVEVGIYGWRVRLFPSYSI